MKILSEKAGLERLRHLKDRLRSEVAVYEQQAQSCATCRTPGECCLDQHFVNVRISRLEAVAIASVIRNLAPIRKAAVTERVLTATTDTRGHFACPLYEKGSGCLVHDEAKPVPCIMHACYERSQDLPPDSMQDEYELAVARLNEGVYRDGPRLESLPSAVTATIERQLLYSDL